MKKFFCFIFSSFLIFNIYSNTSSSASANRKTALRYLQLAKHYVTQNDWAQVNKICQTGIQYDNSIADLYYLNALSLFNLEYPRYKIIPEIKQSLSSKEWVDYNKSNARIFYADLLCSVGKPEEALDLLSQQPLIYSSDAEYVYIKSLYELNTPPSILKAEERLNSARRVYPTDVRFFYLFFNYEFDICISENKEPSDIAKKIAESFIAHVPDYDKEYKDLEILSSFFTEGETQRRLLKAFNARGFKHILYPIVALKSKIISEEEALDYFLTFIDEKIEAKILMQFYSMIQDENLKNYFDENLNSFNGILVYDTNNSLEENLVVKYERGRPKTITFDFDNDEDAEWEVECDFGMPKKINVFDQNATVIYGTYPEVSLITFNDAEPQVKGSTVYQIIDQTYSSKPFSIIKASQIDSTDFYVVDETSLMFGKNLFDTDKIVSCANLMDKPSLEKSGARIQFSILNGTPYEANYYLENKEYAHGYFTNDYFCVVRNVDNDDDGIFETTEYYAIDDGSMNISADEKTAVTTNVWGTPVNDAPLYLAGISIDRNLDTIKDFKQTYYKNGGVLSEWDSDFDGEYDVKYKKIVSDDKQNVQEEYLYFVNNFTKGKIWVSVLLRNGIPTELKENDESFKLVQGNNKNFYWIGKTAGASYEMNILSEANLYLQGQMFQLEESKFFIRVIKIGDNIFSKIIDKEFEEEKTLSGDENSNEK